MTNYGFKEPVIKKEDFWLGSKKLGSIDLNSKGDWRPYLPTFEPQSKSIETNSCVSFGTLSCLEMIHKLTYNSEPNYSDRFTSKTSGTDPAAGGNTPNKVADAIRKSGTIPEAKYPFVDNMAEYFKEIPQELIDMGADWLKNYDMGYEWVNPLDLKMALKRSPVGVAVSAWQMNDKGEYFRFGQSNHWVALVAFDEQDRPIIWDSYESALKTLAKDFRLDFPMLYTLKKKPDPVVEEYKSGNHYLTMLKEVFRFFKSLIKSIWQL